MGNKVARVLIGIVIAVAVIGGIVISVGFAGIKMYKHREIK